MRKQTWVCSTVLSMVMLAGCGTGNVETPEAQASGTQASGPDTYSINMTSTDSGTGSDYEISDMLPRPSDDTFVISLEDAEALMNNRGNTSADSGTELSEEADESSGKSIVVYFSGAEDIQMLAEYIGEETGAVVFSVLTEESFHVDNMDDYDVIYLGYPNWWDTLPMPVAGFLEEYDFAGKTIIPFASYEDSGLGSGVSMIKELCPDAEVVDGFAIGGEDVNTEAAREAVAEFVAGL